VTFAFRRRI